VDFGSVTTVNEGSTQIRLNYAETMVLGLKGKQGFLGEKWRAWQESNLRLTVPETVALFDIDFSPRSKKLLLTLEKRYRTVT